MALKQPEDGDQLHDWVRGLLEDGRDNRRAHEAIWWQNIARYNGDLWVEFNPHSMKLEAVAAPQHRVRLPINLIQPTVRTEYAKLLKNRPIVDCVAASTEKRDLNSAEVGDKVLNVYVEKRFNKASLRRQVLMWALVTGRGGIFVDYDETAVAEIQVPMGPDGEAVFDPQQVKSIQRYYRDKQHRRAPTTPVRMGELRYAPLSPFQLVWDFSKLDPREASWVIVSEVYDNLNVKRRWGKIIEVSKNVQPNVMERRLLGSLDFTNRLDFNGINYQELVEVHRMFVKPGHGFFPDGVEIIYTDDELIDVLEFPFAHGELPIATMGHIPMPGSRYSMSVVSQIADPVLELSKTESQLVENRNLMANPPWVEFDMNGLADDAIQNKPGLRIKVQWRPNVPEPHPVQMPTMPSYINDLISLLRDHILEISGQGETSQGKVPAGARSGVAIAYLQEEDDTKLGPTVQEYEEMMEWENWLTLQTIAEKYEIPRTMQVFRRHSDPEVIDFVGTQLQGIAGVEVQAGSALPRSKAAKQQFMFDLWDRGVVQDPRKLMEMLELTQSEAADWEDDIRQAERENFKLQQGQPQQVLDWYNHTVHQATHRKFMKTADFDALHPDVQKIFFDHDELHTKALQDAQFKQAAMGMVTGGQGGDPSQNGGPPPTTDPSTQAQLASSNGMNQPQPQQGGIPSTPPPQALQNVEPQ